MSNDQKLRREADALGLTIEELQALKRDAADLAEAECRGMELWELRMRQRGYSEEAIEKRRAEITEKIRKILCL
jgi:hypothetical protein